MSDVVSFEAFLNEWVEDVKEGTPSTLSWSSFRT